MAFPGLGRDRAGTPSAAPPFDSAASDAGHAPELYAELQESAYSLSGTAADETNIVYGPLDGENTTTLTNGEGAGNRDVLAYPNGCREEQPSSELQSDPADGGIVTVEKTSPARPKISLTRRSSHQS